MHNKHKQKQPPPTEHKTQPNSTQNQNLLKPYTHPSNIIPTKALHKTQTTTNQTRKHNNPSKHTNQTQNTQTVKPT